MCNCGCEEPADASYQMQSSTRDQSLPQRRHRHTMGRSTNAIDARRILTYDDEDDDYPVSRQRYPGKPPRSPSVQGADGRLDLSGTPGVAIVQRTATNMNGSLDYAEAVRRHHTNGRKSSKQAKCRVHTRRKKISWYNKNFGSKMSQKYRAALPPYGRPPCCQNNPAKTQARGCPVSKRN